MILKSILAGTFKLDGGAMFGVVPKKVWSKLIACDEQNRCTWSMRCLYVEYGDKKILIDSGMGLKQEAKFYSYYEPQGNIDIRAALHVEGIDPLSITDLLLTHLHFDHVGGSLYFNEEGQATRSFPNATYWVHSSQWQNAMSPNAREKPSFLSENILPLEPYIKFFQSNKSPFEHIELIKLDGHSLGMVLPMIQVSKHKKILFAADLFPSVHHIPIPYVMAYDMQPLITLREKEEILKMMSNQNIALFLEHDALHEVVTITTPEKGKYLANERMTLVDWLAKTE